MPVAELARPTDNGLKAWDAFQGFSRFRDERVEEAIYGELNEVLLTENFVVKIPHPGDNFKHQRAATYFESLLLADLHDCPNPPPLAIPRCVELNTDKPPYSMVFTRVPGTVLGHETVRQLSAPEKEQIGKKLGSFVAWMETAMPLPAYQRVIQDVTEVHAKPTIPDRIDFIEDALVEILTRQDIDFDLFNRLFGVYCLSDSKSWFMKSQRPRSVGHDDLRADNLTFMQVDGQWQLHGVIDFGLTKPSSPERELRHVAPLGREMFDAAHDEYEARSNMERLISPGHTLFWGLMQTITNYSNAIKVGNEAKIESKRRDLDCMLGDPYTAPGA